MAQLVPFVGSEPNYRFSAVLGEVQYIFDVRWNEREEAWYFDILDEDETAIRTGLKIVLGVAIGASVTNPDFPAGIFVARDLSNAGRDATFSDLGTRVILYFLPDSEIGL